MAGALTLSLGVTAYVRNETWRSESALWADVLAKNPTSGRAHHNAGWDLQRRSRFEAAIAHYRIALPLLSHPPETAQVHFNLGLALAEQGEHEDAIREYGESIRVESLPMQHYHLARSLMSLGRDREAELQLRLNSTPQPQRGLVHRALGLAVARQGRLSEARRELRLALQFEPNEPLNRQALERVEQQATRAR